MQRTLIIIMKVVIWILIVAIIATAAVRFTPYQQRNPFAVEIDCSQLEIPSPFDEGEDPRVARAYQEQPARSIIFGMKCAAYEAQE